MDVALTGTPGVGKSSAAEILKGKGYSVLSVADLAVELGCSIPSGDEMEVDISSMAALMLGRTVGLGERVFIDGHLSHLLPVDLVVVLRLEPRILRERLSSRCYSSEKLEENIEAEIVGVCLSEAVETGLPVAEVNTTGRMIEDTASIILDLAKRYENEEGFGPFSPGNVDWLEVGSWD